MEKALVVDDRGLDYRLKRGLSERGYSVLFAEHPTDAMRLLDDGVKPQLVISDINGHPDYNGIEFVKKVRDKLGQDSRIFLWSGHIGDLVEDISSLDGNIPLTDQVHELYLQGVIDGYMPRTVRSQVDTSTMFDLIDSPHFLLFAAKHTLSAFEDIDPETLRQIAEHVIAQETGINLSFGDKPSIPIPRLFIPAYF